VLSGVRGGESGGGAAAPVLKNSAQTLFSEQAQIAKKS